MMRNNEIIYVCVSLCAYSAEEIGGLGFVYACFNVSLAGRAANPEIMILCCGPPSKQQHTLIFLERWNVRHAVP